MRNHEKIARSCDERSFRVYFFSSLLGGDRQFSSYGELTAHYNGISAANFEECMTKVTGVPWGCSKVTMKNALPASSQKVNGDYWWLWILAEFEFVGVDANNKDVSYTKFLDKNYGANVYYFCRDSWLTEQEFTTDGRVVRCVKYEDDPPSCPSSHRFNPIDASTGKKLQREVDYESGDGTLRVVRVYAGQYTGWLFDDAPQLFDMTGRAPSARTCRPGMASYRVGGIDVHTSYCFTYSSPSGKYNEVDLMLPEGSHIRFIETSPGIFVAEDVTRNAELSLIDPGLNGGALWRFKSGSDTVTYYGDDGRILRIDRRGGRGVFYRYENGRLISKADDGGRTILYDTDISGRIMAVTLPDGQKIEYVYAGALLSQVIRHDGSIRQYLYNEPGLVAPGAPPIHALTGIIDESANRYATWTYDAKGRAVSSSHANGAEAGALVYNADGSTTATDALGKQTTYQFTTINGVKKVVRVLGHPSADCAGANKSYVYGVDGTLISATDWKDTKTTYVRDAQGRELSRTEAAGTPEARTITTEWHPQWSVPIRISEPGKVTVFTYDDKGQLLSRNETAAP